MDATVEEAFAKMFDAEDDSDELKLAKGILTMPGDIFELEKKANELISESPKKNFTPAAGDHGFRVGEYVSAKSECELAYPSRKHPGVIVEIVLGRTRDMYQRFPTPFECKVLVAHKHTSGIYLLPLAALEKISILDTTKSEKLEEIFSRYSHPSMFEEGEFVRFAPHCATDKIAKHALGMVVRKVSHIHKPRKVAYRDHGETMDVMVDFLVDGKFWTVHASNWRFVKYVQPTEQEYLAAKEIVEADKRNRENKKRKEKKETPVVNSLRMEDID